MYLIMLNLNHNLTDIVIKKIFNNVADNQSKLIYHLKIIIQYSKYDICYKNSKKFKMGYPDFYTYFFKYRIRYKRKVSNRFIDLCIKKNFTERLAADQERWSDRVGRFPGHNPKLRMPSRLS